MLPGLWPTLLHGSGNPMRNGQMYSSSWTPDGIGYLCNAWVEFEGGVGPFTYFWFTEGGGVTILNPTSNPTTARASSGIAIGAECVVTDSTGAVLIINGTLGA